MFRHPLRTIRRGAEYRGNRDRQPADQHGCDDAEHDQTGQRRTAGRPRLGYADRRHVRGKSVVVIRAARVYSGVRRATAHHRACSCLLVEVGTNGLARTPDRDQCEPVFLAEVDVGDAGSPASFDCGASVASTRREPVRFEEVAVCPPRVSSPYRQFLQADQHVEIFRPGPAATAGRRRESPHPVRA